MQETHFHFLADEPFEERNVLLFQNNLLKTEMFKIPDFFLFSRSHDLLHGHMTAQGAEAVWFHCAFVINSTGSKGTRA